MVLQSVSRQAYRLIARAPPRTRMPHKIHSSIDHEQTPTGYDVESRQSKYGH
jgi:hypothetical protein